MLNHYRIAMPLYDAAVEEILKNQCTDPSSTFYGVKPDFIKGFAEAWDGCRQAAHLITAYYAPGAAHYHDPILLERAALAIDYTLRRINDDGSIDLMECNFHDATANGFAINDLGAALLVMMRDTEHSAAEDAVIEKCLVFVRASTEAMINLGFHTPNHRWVLSAGLSYCYKITGDERCLAHIKKFLDEGIDCDENGEYTERSTGVYNYICNFTLMIISDQLDMPELRENVARNLRLCIKFFEPDNTVNTLNSKRQDFGNVIDYRMYYANYLSMALYDGDGDLAYMADMMLEQIMGRFHDSGSTQWLPNMALFLLHTEWEAKQETIAVTKPDFNYELFMPVSGILRYRRDDVTLTVIKDRPGFCQLQKGRRRIMFRMSAPFFGRGQFIAQSIEAVDGGYRLHMHREAGYLRPFDEPQASPFWDDMDHSKRANIGMRDYDVTVDIKIYEHSLEVGMNCGGCDNVPVKLEFIMEPNAILDMGSAELITRAGDYLYLKSGDVSYTYPEGCSFKFCSAFGKHHYGKTMRDSIFGDTDRVTLAMTDFTPCSRKAVIEF